MDQDAGPNDAPPSLPVGWIAQWDAGSRKYYFVQISTGESVWEIPTQDAPLVPSPGVTPAQPQGPYSRPGDESQAQTGDRGLGTMAMNALMNNGNKTQQQAGLEGLAQQLLGGGKSSGNSSVIGQLAGSLLGGNSQQGQQSYLQHSAQSSGAAHQSGGGFLSNLMGHSQHSNYGYSSNGQTGTYTGQAPPASYQETRHEGNAGMHPQNQQHGHPSSQQHMQNPSHDHYASSQAGYGAPQTSYSADAPPQPDYGQQPPSYGHSQIQYGEYQPYHGGPAHVPPPMQYGNVAPYPDSVEPPNAGYPGAWR